MTFTIEYVYWNDFCLKNKITLSFKTGFIGIWREDDEILGIIQGRNIQDKKISEMYIYNFEVIDKNQGYGKKCILYLFKKYKNLNIIKGYSKDGVESFWGALGAKFLITCDDCIDNKECKKKGFKCVDRTSKAFELKKDTIYIKQ